MGCMTRERRTQACYLAFNFISAIGVTLINKHCFKNIKFAYPAGLCNIHYLFTWTGVEVMRRLDMFQPIKVVNYDKNFWACVVLVGVVMPLNNSSLNLNSMGFHQFFKLLVSPAIVVLEYILDGKTISWKRAICLIFVLGFVVLSSSFDLEYSIEGVIVACVWLPLAAAYKVQWGRVQRQQNCCTSALLHVVLPYAMVVQTCLVPFTDPPGIISFRWTVDAVFWVTLSGVVAFLTNLSGFLVIGNISGLAHVLLGQLKTSIICLGAYYLFDNLYTVNQLLSAGGAIVSIVLYTYVCSREKYIKSQQDKETDQTPKGDLEAPLITKNTISISTKRKDKHVQPSHP